VVFDIGVLPLKKGVGEKSAVRAAV